MAIHYSFFFFFGKEFITVSFMSNSQVLPEHGEWCSLLSHSWWDSLIKFMMGFIMSKRREHHFTILQEYLRIFLHLYITPRVVHVIYITWVVHAWKLVEICVAFFFFFLLRIVLCLQNMCLFGQLIFCQLILQFSLFLLLFMGLTILFGIIHGSHCTISTKIYIYLQYFQ